MSVLISVYNGGGLMDGEFLLAWKPVVALTTPTGVIAILIILFICTDEYVFCSILNVNNMNKMWINCKYYIIYIDALAEMW